MFERILKEIFNVKKYVFEDKNPDRIKVISKKAIISSALESLIYTILIILIFKAIPFTRHNFLSLNMHPLAVMVALISLRYGIYSGFVSAFIATAGYLAVYLFMGNDIILFFLKFQYHKFFIMFLFIAMILGKFQANRKVNEEEAKRDILKLNKLMKEEKEKNYELLTINRDLKNQIIQNKGGIITFRNISKKLNKLLTVEEIFSEIINTINQFINCENASVYILKNNNLNQIIKIGNSSLEKRLDIESKKGNGFLLTKNKKEAQQFPIDLKAQKPIFIAPIFYGKQNIGFVEITKLSYKTQQSENFELFKIVVEEINKALYKIFLQNEKKNLKIFEKETFITTNDYFEQILMEVKKRKKYYNQKYSLIEGENKNNYSAEKLYKKLEELQKEGYTSDYVSIDGNRIRFLFVNESDENNKKQLEILKKILKEEKLYEI